MLPRIARIARIPRIARIACLPLLLLSLKAAPAVRTQVPAAAAAAPNSRTCILLLCSEKSTMRKQHTSFYCAFFKHTFEVNNRREI